MNIEGIPETITREQYLALIRSAGFDSPGDLRDLEFRPDGIYAVVYVRDDDGGMVVDREARVYVRVVE